MVNLTHISEEFMKVNKKREFDYEMIYSDKRLIEEVLKSKKDTKSEKGRIFSSEKDINEYCENL